MKIALWNLSKRKLYGTDLLPWYLFRMNSNTDSDSEVEFLQTKVVFGMYFYLPLRFLAFLCLSHRIHYF